MLLTVRRGIHTWVLELPRISGAVMAHSTICILPPKSSYQGQYLVQKEKKIENVVCWISLLLPLIGGQSMTSIPWFGTSSKVPQFTGRLMLNTNSSNNWVEQYYPALRSSITSCMGFWIAAFNSIQTDIIQRQDYHYLKYYARANG